MPVMRVPAPMHTGNFARDSLNLAIAGARNLQIDMFNRQEAAWLASRQQALIGKSLKHRTNGLVVMVGEQRTCECGRLEIGFEVRG
jgi:hypothetical protein